MLRAIIEICGLTAATAAIKGDLVPHQLALYGHRVCEQVLADSQWVLAESQRALAESQGCHLRRSMRLNYLSICICQCIIK